MKFGSLSQHPAALKTWLFSEFTERLCFFSIRALLTIIMIRSLHFDEESAVMTIAMFSSYCYLTPLLGAVIADRWLPYESAVIFGCILIAIGYFIIGLPGDQDIFWGLSFVITGMGFYKTNLVTCISGLYERKDERRRNEAFMWFYAIVDISLLIATGCLAWVARYSWHSTFIGLASFMIVSLVLTLRLTGFMPSFQWRSLFTRRNLLIGLFTCAQVITFNCLLAESKSTGPILGGVFACVALYCGWMTYRSSSEDRKNLIIVLFFALICIIFMSFIEQLGYSILLYIEHHVNRTVFTYEIPAPFFITLEPLGFILLLPLVSRFLNFWNPSTITKFILAFFLLAVGFAILAWVTYPRNNEGSYYSISLAILFLATAQIFILPSFLSLVTRLAPPHMASMTIAISFLSMAFSAGLAGQFSKLSIDTHMIDGVLTRTHDYFYLFWWITAGSLAMTALLAIFKAISRQYRLPL
jgi:proton-dependent oligopeptide transporter, POT family